MIGTPTESPSVVSSRNSRNCGVRQSPLRGMAESRESRLSSSKVFESDDRWLRIGRGDDEAKCMLMLNSSGGDNSFASACDARARDGSILTLQGSEQHPQGRSCSSSVATGDSAPSNSGTYSGNGAGDGDGGKQEFRHHRTAAFQEWQHELHSPSPSSAANSRDNHHLLEGSKLRTTSEIQSCSTGLAAGPSNGLQVPMATEVASDSTTTDTNSEAPPEDTALAVNHMLAERKRRRKQNDSIQMLRDLVPNIKKVKSACSMLNPSGKCYLLVYVHA